MNPRRDFIKQMSLASAAIIATPSFAKTNFFASDIKHALEDALLPNTVDIVTALHACDAATDDAILFGLKKAFDTFKEAVEDGKWGGWDEWAEMFEESEEV